MTRFLLLVLVVLAGCCRHRIPFADAGHGTYLCSNYWCQRFETDNCHNVALLTYLRDHTECDSKQWISNRLRDHDGLMMELNDQQLRQAP